MHYKLRPIGEVQFGFAHFVPHFISVQIFQINFPLILYASKCYRQIFLSFYICRGQNEGIRDRLNLNQFSKYLIQATGAEIFAKQYLFFQNFDFTMKGASDEDDIFCFFSSNDPYCYHKKNQLRLSPPSGFTRHLSLF